MEITVNTNNHGFTLIEFLVAVVIMTVGLLGLLQTVNVAISHNTTNMLRQEAAILADERMNLEKVKPFTLISTTPAPYVRSYPISQRVVNGAFKNYSIVKTNQDVTTLTKNIDLQVIWHYKNERFVHSISSLVSQYE